MEKYSEQLELSFTFKTLKFVFVILPIVAGADKFIHLLTDWDKYLNPVISDMLPFSVTIFMMGAGIIEIIAGLIVFLNPRVGGIIIAVWLVAIGISLLAGGIYLDVAIRDIVIAVAAFSMSKLAKITA